MREGSAWIQQLEAAYDRADYELIPYVRLGDWLIDSANAAPEGESPYWVPNRFLQSAHIGAVTDDRIFADILRRLRGEPPLTRQPRAPLPRQAAAD